MRTIECDHCGAEILEEDALTSEVDGDVYFFCSPECLEAKEYAPGHDDPDEEEAGGSAPASG
jgi:YHS domain-containing protein